MLRTPRARLPAIKYLAKRIPNSARHAKDHATKGLVFAADYTIRIANREVTLTENSVVKEMEQGRIEALKESVNDLRDYFYFYYPNKSQMVINALLTGLMPPKSGENFLVTRASLDFLVSHMPIHSAVNNNTE